MPLPPAFVLRLPACTVSTRASRGDYLRISRYHTFRALPRARSHLIDLHSGVRRTDPHGHLGSCPLRLPSHFGSHRTFVHRTCFRLCRHTPSCWVCCAGDNIRATHSPHTAEVITLRIIAGAVSMVIAVLRFTVHRCVRATTLDAERYLLEQGTAIRSLLLLHCKSCRACFRIVAASPLCGTDRTSDKIRAGGTVLRSTLISC